MKNDYEILGLSAEADEKDIKRAYFKLVRQYTPEKDPERFQEIREAYENLKKGKPQVALVLKIPNDSFAKRMFEQIETLYRQRAYIDVMDTAEEAIRYYGEWEGFLYYLALSQRRTFYSGKAVNNFEKLVELNPDNVEFEKELALSYLERGWGKKAYAAFGKAYDMGCREIEFLDSYAINCKDRKDYKRSVSLLFEVVAAGMADRKEYMLNLLDAYAGLFSMNYLSGGERLEEAKKSIITFLEEAASYLPEYLVDLEDLIRTVVYVLRSMGRFDDTFGELLRDRLTKGIGREKCKELWDNVQKEVEGTLIDKDPRLSEVIYMSYASFVRGDDILEDYSERLKKFSILDSKLCILEEWPDIRKEFEIVREDYPDFYDAVKGYLDTLEQAGNLDSLRERMLQDYNRLEQNISGGMYYVRYPDRRRKQEVIFEGGYDSGPYVRMQPKVGRNDPCPCGSGKKYKKCCGKA